MARVMDVIDVAWLPAMLQLASPALPIGAFSYSQGFESAVNIGWVKNEQQAQAWIDAQFRQSFLPREIYALNRMYALNDLSPSEQLRGLLTLNTEFIASRDSAEARLETRQIGASLLRWLEGVAPACPEIAVLRAIKEQSTLGLSGPIAFGLSAQSQHLPAELACLSWAFSWIENQVQAAVKLVPLGQTAGQRLLTALRPLCHLPAPDEPWSCTPKASLLMMRHERQYSRLFRS